MPWHQRFLRWLARAPFWALGWVAAEMGRQLVGKAKSAFAPLLWPVAGLSFLYVVYRVGGEQSLNSALTYAVVIGGLYVGLRMIFRPMKKKKKK